MEKTFLEAGMHLMEESSDMALEVFPPAALPSRTSMHESTHHSKRAEEPVIA